MHGAGRSPGRPWGAAILMIAALGGCADKSRPPRQISGADPQRGLELIRQSGCGACHVVPGLDWPRGAVGGSLKGFGARPLIAGRFPNQPGVLVAWLRDAPSLAPETAMPPSSLSQDEARDVAAYLYGLDER
jgi:sulfur-oxidizing protein SoxX